MARHPRQGLLFGLDDDPPERPAAAPRAERRTADRAAADRPAGERAKPQGEAAGPPDLRGKTVYVVDAHSLIFQVFHAIPEMSSPEGRPVNAVFGFTRDILFLLEEKKPDYLFCAFDMPGPTFRHEQYEEYKAHREEMPDDLVPQLESIERVLEGLSVPAVAAEGYEADDVLATLAAKTEELGGECYLVTGDKDCRQLISDRVKIYNVRKNLVFDARALNEEWGIRPDQVVDFQALVGDKVDNVPGVPLIGPKIARELIGRFGTLEEVLANADQVSGKKRKQNLIDFADQARLSRELVALDRDVPLEFDWRAGEVAHFDKAPALPLFVEFGFHSFADKIRAEVAARAAPAQWHADYRLVSSLGELEQLAKQLAGQERICVDTETTHNWPTWAELVGVALAWQEGQSYYVPLRAPPGDPQLDPQQALELLRPVLENPAIEKVGQNLKYDIIVLRNHGLELAGERFDTMLASYLLDAGERNHSLDELSKRYLRHETLKIKELIGSGKSQRRMDEVPAAEVAAYAGEDVDVPLRLQPILSESLEEAGLDELYRKLELPLVDVLVEMECHGVRIDTARLAELSEKYQLRLEALEREIFRLAGREFNIASPKQLQQVLFEEQKLPSQKRTKSGSSTDAGVLEQLARHHELPARILEHRQYAKLKGTYVDALPAMVNPRTGRVHCSFQQAVTATGRLSATDPNLQNIPIRTEAGREIRSAFLPGESGWKLLAADYSQIELRVLAHYSGDANLLVAFRRDEDIHARVAAQVNGVPLEGVTADMRRRAKAVNFGIVYGLSPWGLARQLDIDKEEAAEFIEAYFDRYPGVGEFLAKALEECRRNGYAKTILGRRRAIQGIRPNARRQRNLSERTAVNTVIQGSAADLIKLAMINIHRRLRHERSPARLLLQIHDELVFEVPGAHLQPLASLVSHEMSQVIPLSVPVKVDLATGDNWAQLEPHEAAQQS